ncbi:MAG TPA: tail fiber domain-containing protein [Thermoanaerobaculia bacterium]|jgi:hypothetical protein|nr:tail fiber domain-containing protein [Thermoanaerobaculia bacterium]
MRRPAKIRVGFSTLLLLAVLTLGAVSAQAQPYLGTGAGNPGVSTGSGNTALGDNALSSNTSGFFNTAVGFDASQTNTTGFDNTAVGTFSLNANVDGSVNTAIGTSALPSNTRGNSNTAVGVESLNGNTTANANTAVGFEALASTTTGGNNTAVGSNALLGASGSGNIGIGVFAGGNLGNGSNNIDIGNNPPGNESNTIRIGNTAVQTATFLAGVNGATSSSGVPVYVNSSGQLGTITSSLRFKDDVEDMGDATVGLMKLRPVTFRYKAGVDDGTRLLQYGLVAEEVAKVYPDLVQYDDKGQPFTVRYHMINAMLLNEVQKQHGTIEQQKSQLEEQEARIQRLEALVGKLTETAKP